MKNNIKLTADYSRCSRFLEELKNKRHLLDSVPDEFIIARLHNILMTESPLARNANELVTVFSITDSVESFIASTLGAYHGD